MGANLLTPCFYVNKWKCEMKKEVRNKERGDRSFTDRLALCAKKAGNASKLSEKAGISKTSMSDYIKGNSEVYRSRLIDIANAAGVSILWLTTGEGKPEDNHSESQSIEGLLEKTVRSSIISLKTYLDKDGADLAPNDLAEAVFLCCELADENGIVNQETVKRLMKFKGK